MQKPSAENALPCHHQAGKQAPYRRNASRPACGSRPSHALNTHALALLGGGRCSCREQREEALLTVMVWVYSCEGQSLSGDCTLHATTAAWHTDFQPPSPLPGNPPNLTQCRLRLLSSARTTAHHRRALPNAAGAGPRLNQSSSSGLSGVGARGQCHWCGGSGHGCGDRRSACGVGAAVEVV